MSPTWPRSLKPREKALLRPDLASNAFTHPLKKASQPMPLSSWDSSTQRQEIVEQFHQRKTLLRKTRSSQFQFNSYAKTLASNILETLWVSLCLNQIQTASSPAFPQLTFSGQRRRTRKPSFASWLPWELSCVSMWSQRQRSWRMPTDWFKSLKKPT